jgi:hypothetical protein
MTRAWFVGMDVLNYGHVLSGEPRIMHAVNTARHRNNNASLLPLLRLESNVIYLYNGTN